MDKIYSTYAYVMTTIFKVDNLTSFNKYLYNKGTCVRWIYVKFNITNQLTISDTSTVGQDKIELRYDRKKRKMSSS